MKPLLIYGANGYTGRLIVEEALRRGVRPILSGRSAAVRAIADALGLEYRLASLDNPTALDRALAGVGAVIHAAGPFSRTSEPMVDACMRARVPYLDITGEITVFERCAARDAEARQAGVMLLPGAGFDVVPSDCLAAHLARRLPGATALTLAFHGGSSVSHGTATTMAENIGRGGAVRRRGAITPVPAAWRTRSVTFADKPRLTVTIPWGDISTAFHSTGIPDITVYTAAPQSSVRAMRLTRYFGWLLATPPAQWMLKRAIDARPAGPDEHHRARARAQLWGEVTHP
ncbi:MAG: saccharopine dehydrogenase NADP-binding domain-containing protein, partial [Gemmatimonadaceae bacterium]|nr:saccharopine dehydrogenase NADP-binding domain-containing protein [Gemmatimonadaceae bacterium]